MDSLRVMVFYDGNYFKQGNVYFRYKEERGWLNFKSLHSVFERYAADKATHAPDTTKIVAAHYYDGRTSTNVATADALHRERDFEMSLIRAGIVPHYSPVRETPKAGPSQDEHGFTLAQKGVDVELSIDVLDFAHSDRYDVAVLVAGDEDFVPLVRRIGTLGKHTLLAYFAIDGWTDKNGKQHRSTFTSRALQDAASWRLDLNAFAKDPARSAETRSLFFLPK
jgi:uncharacterized LabA/DUF88 family protein